MKNGLLVCKISGNKKNVGDYVQSLAQEQFYDHIDCLVQREAMNTFCSDDKVRVIMNAWFMHHPQNFPPSECILPLFVSFHLTPKAAEEFLSKETLAYLKEHEPIGTRDYATLDILQRHGIDAYFSGCLTLTLGKTYKTNEKTDRVYFVDPYYELGNGETLKHFGLLKAFFLLAKNYRKVIQLCKVFESEKVTRVARISGKLDKMLHAASFYDSYSKVFDDEIIMNACYLSQMVSRSEFGDDYKQLEHARQLINTYARAKFVVTSRIHCALPCLGLETPVVFVNSQKLRSGKSRSGGRYGGLTELMNECLWTPKGLTPCFDIGKAKIGRSNIPRNKDDYKKLSEALTRRVHEFIASSDK